MLDAFVLEHPRDRISYFDFASSRFGNSLRPCGHAQGVPFAELKARDAGGSMENGHLTRQELLRQLTQTAAGTPMGTLLRSFWQPVAPADSVEPGKARALRVLSEDLTLYRGESGTPYLIGARCAHRCTVLHTGWVQDDQVRCMYHGWRYDGTGRCTEMPAEKNVSPDLVKIAGYPVHEYGGLLFAYLGTGIRSAAQARARRAGPVARHPLPGVGLQLLPRHGKLARRHPRELRARVGQSQPLRR
jgi:nitrite reductase/ring-hydroxylating ferredoxin subunit